jgi:hypothetical protein
MSSTPLTDAEAKCLGRKPGEVDVYWVKADFARDLEKALREVAADLVQKLNGGCYSHAGTIELVEKARAALKGGPQ